MDPVDRTNKLIGLAASPEDEEARTAAHQACELIRKHKLIVAPRDEYERLIQTAIDQCDRIKRLTEELARSEEERKQDLTTATRARKRKAVSSRDQIVRIAAKAGGRIASTLLRDVLSPNARDSERER